MNAVSIRLPNDIAERLQRLADQTGRTKTFYMLEAIKMHMEDLEDVYLAEYVLERVRSGEEHTYTLEKVRKDIGLEN